MAFKSNKFIITALVGIFIFLLTLSSSFLFYYLLFIVLGRIICWKLASNKDEKKILLNLLYVVLPFYILFSFIIYQGYLLENRFFIFSDQSFFYSNIEELVSTSNSFYDVFKKTMIERIHYDYEGYFLLAGTAGYFAEYYLDGNNIFIQSILVSSFSVLINIYLIKILCFYIPRKKAYKYTLLFAFCSPILYYSPWVLRDMPIALFYTIAFYLIHKKWNIINFFTFIGLILITMQFRTEHGLFLLVFPMIYTYLNKQKNYFINKIWPIIFSITSVIFIYIFVLLIPQIEKSIKTVERYNKFTNESLNDGFGSKLYSLPPVIKEFALMVNSQITPLPPWVNLNLDYSWISLVMGLLTFIFAVFWSKVFLVTFFSFFNKSIRKKTPKIIYILLGIFFLFLLANVSNINVRRLIAVYPIFFLIYVYIKESNFQNYFYKKYNQHANLVYLTLIILYISIKSIL
tara:strand:+ start:4563 stop:5939 length:1377 start_codon:yes stop_codon:yes gene_type:complete